jgi:hypothetical protein
MLTDRFRLFTDGWNVHFFAKVIRQQEELVHNLEKLSTFILRETAATSPAGNSEMRRLFLHLETECRKICYPLSLHDLRIGLA